MHKIHKLGDVREDGKVFFRYQKKYKNNERWVTPDQFKNYTNKANENAKKWREENPERYRDKQKKWQIDNREKANYNASAWRKRNVEKVREINNEYTKKRRKSDSLYALKSRVRNLTAQAFRLSGFSKKSQSCKYLGCEWEFLKRYIEQRFQEGMTWENRSEWHIDHIIPLASAKTETQLIKLFHYTNLQPLWAEQNLKKWKHQNKQMTLI